MMKLVLNISFIFLLLACILFVQCSDEIKAVNEAPIQSENNIIERGKYLVEILGCQNCHSPKSFGPQGPEIIPELQLSGYPSDRPVGKIIPGFLDQNDWILFGSDGTVAAGPWGVSFAANITSDESGIGSWSYEQFKIAFTLGKYKGLESGRPLLPPMRWFNYSDMKEDDILAIFQYLKSTPPVRNLVPAPTLANF